MLSNSNLILDEAQDAVCIDLIPAKSGNLSTAQFRELLNSSAFASFALLEDEVEQGLKDLFTRAQGENADTPFRIRVAERRNGQWRLTLSTDQMSLRAELVSPEGGKAASFAQLLDALQELGVSQGLLRPAIDELIQEGARGAPGSSVSAEIARGRSPRHGEHARLERLVPLARERMLRPQEQDGGKVDMRDLGSVIMVRPGQPLMRRHPSTPAQDGYTVTGKPLKAKPGKDLAMQPGKGTELDPQNSNLLRATQSGQPVESRNGMAVDEVLTVKLVDAKHGHIDYEGSVMIQGEVAEGMRIRATGDITVGGFVDGARLEAGGDIVVNQGVVGRHRDDGSLTCSLIAKGQIAARFVQYTLLDSGSDISVERQLMHSHVHCRGTLKVGDEQGRKGDLVGGEIRCSGPVEAVNLGARAGTHTRLILGDSIQDLKTQHERLAQKLKALEDQAMKLRLAQRKLTPVPESGVDPLQSLRQQLTLGRERVDAQHAAFLEQQTLLSGEIERFFDRVQITVRAKLFPRVECEIGPAQGQSQKETGPSLLRNQEGKFTISPLV
ncbi:FapA family protein [Marinobacter hydrocarbonoclasticus]|nr:FapA family protein [Marinobacter nauticus]